MEMMYYHLPRFSHQESVKIIEADIQHANALAAEIPRAKGGAHLQMKLVYNHFAPIILFFLQWLDCSCACFLPGYLNLFDILVYKVYADGRPNITNHGRKATVKDFYAVILPSLCRLHSDSIESEDYKDASCSMKVGKVGCKDSNGFSCIDSEREDECGICLEPCTKMVLPNCCHEMCINCYRDCPNSLLKTESNNRISEYSVFSRRPYFHTETTLNTRSESCPFCRGNMKRVKSRDLWVLTCDDDVVDTETVTQEDLLRFYLYISRLPKDSSEAMFLMHYEYLL